MAFGRESLRWWFPRIEHLGIPQPSTVVVPVRETDLKRFAFLDEELPGGVGDALMSGASVLGFPLFLRTDVTSYKQAWERACFVPSVEALLGER